MKKLVIAFAFSFFAYNASPQKIIDRTTGDPLMRHKALSSNNPNIEGSPYLSDVFTHATISGTSEKFMARYNAKNDEIEIKKSHTVDAFILPKESPYDRISIKSNNYILRLLHYKNSDKEDVYGYLAELYLKDSVSLLRRDKIIFQKDKEGTSYSDPTPLKLVKGPIEYYLLLKDKRVIEFPKNGKALAYLFQDKRTEIGTFLKTNRPSFKDEKDMIKIADFISTL